MTEPQPARRFSTPPGSAGRRFGPAPATQMRPKGFQSSLVLGLGGWWVRGDAVLPTPRGESVAAYCQARGVFKPPPGWPGYNEQQRRDWRNWVARQLLLEDFGQEHPHLSGKSLYAEFGRVHAEWLRARKLTASKSAICDGRRRLRERAEVPRRGRPPGSGKKEWHPRAEYLCDQFLFHQHGNAADIYRTLEAFAAKEDFPAPTYKMVRKRLGDKPEGANTTTLETPLASIVNHEIGRP